MGKYIDADRLKELLDAKYKEFTEKAKKDCPLQYQYMADGLDIAEQFIDYLQQEQPEVDLEKELQKLDNAYFDLDGIAIAGTSYYLKVEDLKYIARHFYELGKNSK